VLPPGTRQDFPGLILAPGFIDIHIHGSAGHDVMEADTTALSEIQRRVAKHGVTSYLPTTATAPQDRILKALEHLGRSIAARNAQPQGALPLGIHLGGPFISHVKRGVHPPEHLVSPWPDKFDLYWQASQGTIHMMTVGPDLPGAIETIPWSLGVHSSLHRRRRSRRSQRGALVPPR
jgi:N-acetylglucosamine-6-phosphate deacetylase